MRNFTNFGLFVSWKRASTDWCTSLTSAGPRRSSTPPVLQRGDEIEVVVLELDKENRRMSLGHKQIEENPWEVFESVFAVGSKHQATWSRWSGHATIALPYGLEGTCHSKHLNKQEGGALGVDDKPISWCWSSITMPSASR